MDDKRTIIIADDHPLFRTALQQAIGQAFGDCQIHEAGTLDDLQQTLEDVPHGDFLLLDLQMPGTFGYSGLIFIREQFPELPIIIVSGNEAPATIHQCLNYGAAGYIAKSQSLPEMPRRSGWSTADNCGSRKARGTAAPRRTRTSRMWPESSAA